MQTSPDPLPSPSAERGAASPPEPHSNDVALGSVTPEAGAGRGTLAAWLRRYLSAEVLLAVLVALVPVHIVSAPIGFSLKPWFLPLAALAVVAGGTVVRSLRNAPWPLTIGLGMMIAGGALGATSGSGSTSTAARHLVALTIAAFVAVAFATLRLDARKTAIAVRIGAVAMPAAALVESAFLFSGTALDFMFRGIPNWLKAPGDLGYGVILYARGLHTDSNFSAVYAAAFLFLLLIFPLGGKKARRWDSVIAGLLVVQIFVAFSRTGAIALLLGIITFVVVGGISGLRRLPLNLGVAAITAVVALATLVSFDAIDRSSDIAAGLDRRTRLLGGLFSDLYDVATDVPEKGGAALQEKVDEGSEQSPDLQARGDIFVDYARTFGDRPLTGVGYGVGQEQHDSYAHNGLLEAAAGGGVLAVAGWVLLWTGAGHALWRRRRSRASVAPLTGLWAVVLTGGMLLTAIFDPLPALAVGFVYGSCKSPAP